MRHLKEFGRSLVAGIGIIALCWILLSSFGLLLGAGLLFSKSSCGTAAVNGTLGINIFDAESCL